MANKLPQVPTLTSPKGLTDLRGVDFYLRAQFSDLIRLLSEITFKLNGTLSLTGEDTMLGPVTLASFTVATVPAAASYTGGMIFVTNEAGGAVPAFSDGTNWRRVTDRAIIS